MSIEILGNKRKQSQKRTSSNHSQNPTNYIAVDTGTYRYRDSYGNFIPIIRNNDIDKLRKLGEPVVIVGETNLKRASKRKKGVIIKGLRYNVKKVSKLTPCVGYIITSDKKLIKISRKHETYKFIISLCLVASMAIGAYAYLKSDGTWSMMLNKVASSTDFKDRFNYSNQTVSSESFISIENNEHNPVTLQYILYNGSTKIYDTGTLKPGESTELKYEVYFEKGKHSVVCQTIAKSLDGMTVIYDNSKEFTLTVR